jgi:hypothetical protein
MGIQGFPRAAATAIVPKAVCHSCGRPVAFMKSGKCVYCGATVASEGISPAVQAGLSPEILIALEGQSSAGSQTQQVAAPDDRSLRGVRSDRADDAVFMSPHK